MVLAPRLWLQGAELTITSGSGSWKQAAFWAEFRVTFRWVQITAFGWPVEPDVSRYLAGSVGLAAATSWPAFSSFANGTCRGWAGLVAITGRPARPGCSRPSSNIAASSV